MLVKWFHVQMHSTLSLSLISPKEVLTSLQCIQIHLGYLGFVVLISFRCRLDLAGRSNASLNLMAETPWVKQAARFWQLQHLERLDKRAGIWSSKTHLGLLSTRITGGLKFIYFLLFLPSESLQVQSTCPDAAGFWMMSAMLWKASLYAVAWLYFLQRAGTFSYMLHSLWSLPCWDPSTGNPYFMVQTVSQSVSQSACCQSVVENSSPLRANKTWDPKHPKAKTVTEEIWPALSRSRSNNIPNARLHLPVPSFLADTIRMLSAGQNLKV